ncbi:MAG: sulfatase [Planctomycetaceae bacterium]
MARNNEHSNIEGVLMRLLALILVCAASVTAADRPNFLWLISEDNSKHFLKLFDENGAETPNIAKLAEHGLLFDRAFSNAPVCSVARTTLITGCYAPRIGTQNHRRAAMAPLPDGLKMFPTYLRDAGYYTTNRSKTDYNVLGGDAAWDESSNKASWRKRAKGQPFFHKQTLKTSHEGSLHFPTADIENRPTLTDPDSVFINPRHPETKTFRYTYARYHDNIMKIDREVGAVIDQLTEDGLLEDTVIFYFGDHGGVLPGSKGYAYETGLHVPLVVRVPNKWAHLSDFEIGSRVDGFVSFIDFGPTLLRLAGLDVPNQMDGTPFLGEGISADEVNARNTAFGYADRFDEKIDFVRTVRKGRFKYIRNFTPFNYDGLQNNYRYIQEAYAEWRRLYDAGTLNESQAAFFEPRLMEELYDVEADPYETKNLIASAQLDTLQDLRITLAQHLRRTHDLSFLPESVMIERAIANPVQFGEDHADELWELQQIAMPGTGKFDVAWKWIEPALKSDQPLKRYWAAVSCSVFGRDAIAAKDMLMKLAVDDDDLLVRTRATEFLALHAEVDPAPGLIQILGESRDAVQANEILNTIVMLRDGKHRYEIEVTAESIHESIRRDQNVTRRLAYLTSDRGRGERWIRQPRRKPVRQKRGR